MSQACYWRSDITSVIQSVICAVLPSPISFLYLEHQEKISLYLVDVWNVKSITRRQPDISPAMKPEIEQKPFGKCWVVACHNHDPNDCQQPQHIKYHACKWIVSWHQHVPQMPWCILKPAEQNKVQCLLRTYSKDTTFIMGWPKFDIPKSTL